MYAILSVPLLQQGTDDQSVFLSLFCGLWLLVFFTLWGAQIMGKKGHSRLVGALVGGILGLIGIIILAVWPKNKAVLEARQVAATAPKADERVCPHCGETIKIVAKVCKHCHRDV